MYVCVCVCVCLCVCVCVCIYMYIHIYVYILGYIYVYIYWQFQRSDYRRLWRVTTFVLMAVSRMQAIYRRRMNSPIKLPFPTLAPDKTLETLTTDEALRLLLSLEKEKPGEKSVVAKGSGLSHTINKSGAYAVILQV